MAPPSGRQRRSRRCNDDVPDRGQLTGHGEPAAAPSQLRGEEEPIAIDYTSGTTGRPKGAIYAYRGAYLNALGEVIEAELGHQPGYCGRCRCSTATAGASRGR